MSLPPSLAAELALAEAAALEAELSKSGPSAGQIETDWRVWLPAVAPRTYNAGFEWFHADFWNWYWPILQLRRRGQPVPDETPLNCFLPWGRGLAKSSTMEGMALAEGAMIGEAFGVYLSSTQDKAREHLQAIRDLIESSEIAKYYPALSNPRLGKFGNQRGWKSDAIYTDGGFGLVSCSLEQGIRGLKDGNRRPSFIILDDIDERDDSLDVKAEKFEAITQDALPMLAPFGIAVYGQNLIYNGSIADDTLKGKADWFKHRHLVGAKDGANWKPVNTYQDDLEIEKRDGRAVIISGTPNWSRLDAKASQRLLDQIGEKSFWRECQNRTAPDADELVWKTFSPQHSIITWDEYAAVFGTNRIRADFSLVAGYDRGNTGPAKHPGVFTVAAVAPERSHLSGDVFIFYEYVAEATEDIGDMARHLIEDLAKLCGHLEIRKAAELLAQSFRSDVSELEAWQLRQNAGELIPFDVFNGSHEALGERNTLHRNWGLVCAAGKAGKTEGLEQLHHYAKLEDAPHPFREGIQGKPNLWLVVASEQLEAATDRFGLQRLRWEAGNLKWDKKVTTRDVPTKMGDDATDTVKHYMQTFRLVGEELTRDEVRETRLPEVLRLDNAPKFDADNASDAWRWETPRKLALARLEKEEEEEIQRQDPLSVFDRCL